MPFALSGDPSQSEISEALNYLLSNFGANVSADPRTGIIAGPGGDIIGYLYKYLAVKYADSQSGVQNFSDSPTNRQFFGLRNSDDPVESTNPVDYVWYRVTGGFGTTKTLWYKTTGGRRIQFFVSVSNPGTGWAPVPTTSIDLDVLTATTTTSQTFFAFFQPSNLQVPRTGSPLTPNFTGVTPALYATSGNTPVTFVAAQTDTDPTFINNTWRIGNSASTGFGDIGYNNITIGSPTAVSGRAQWPQPTAMAGSPAFITVPVRFKDATGVVSQAQVAQQQIVFVDQGATGNQFTYVYLYQWNIATPPPANPTGTSTYTWATGAHTGYTGSGGWSTTVPANPGTPLLQLWVAEKQISAVAGATTTTVSWSSGFTVYASGQNGATGTSGFQAASPTVYQWALSIPSISGTSTYTWATGVFSPVPAGWSSTITSAPSPGYILWAATVNLTDNATATTSTINWTTASIITSGYAGTNGAAGASSRIMYARISSNPVPVSGTVIVSGDNRPSGAQAAAVWGSAFNVTWYATDPDPTSNFSLYQADGIYNGSTTAWSTPYISSLKVGELSAITTNTGNLTVSNRILAGTAAISGTSMTGSGAVIYSTGNFSFGNSTTNVSFNGSQLTLNGNVVATGNINANGVSNAAFLAGFNGSAVSKNAFYTTGIYFGVWNASTNSPFLQSGIGTTNAYYVVNPGGSTTLDGISTWYTGDIVYFNGTAWIKAWQVLGDLYITFNDAPQSISLEACVNLLLQSGGGNAVTHIRIVETTTGNITYDNGITHLDSTTLPMLYTFSGVPAGLRHFQLSINQESVGGNFIVGNVAFNVLGVKR